MGPSWLERRAGSRRRADGGVPTLLDASAALSEAERLVAAGDPVAAVDLLAEVVSRTPTAEVELRLADLRLEAVESLEVTSRRPWPPLVADPFPDVVGRLPEVSRGELTGDVLTGAVLHHGCLMVRALFDDEQVARTRGAIDPVAARRDGDRPDQSVDRWYRPVGSFGGRRMVANQGGTWLGDSPAASAQILQDLRSSGAITAISGHFGQRPLYSLQKSTLRRSAPVFTFAGWHQDGSFMGPDARAMNVWVALTPCGGDRPTPGLELFPRRIDEVLPTDNGPGSAWIADTRAAAAAGEIAPIHPEFEPGDALLFDERFLHRTYLTKGMTEPRDAVECWFFAPGHGAQGYLSLLA